MQCLKKLHILKQKGYYPDTILDIGAHHGNWTHFIKQIYGDSKYYLFEAIDYLELTRYNGDSKYYLFEAIDYLELTRYNGDNNVKVFNVLLNDKKEEVNWYQMKNTGDSIFREKTFHFKNCEIIKRDTVDLHL